MKLGYGVKIVTEHTFNDAQQDPDKPRLPPGQIVTKKFPIMTATMPFRGPLEDWRLEIDGLVENPLSFSWKSFDALPKKEFTVDIHCVTKWSKLDTVWRGVDLDVLFDMAGPLEKARYVMAKAEGDYSANLRLADLRGGKAFIATHFDGEALTRDHGGPARLVVPSLYFWKSAKWLNSLSLSEYDIKGFWEKLGYHNYGDPWKEQRYRGIENRPSPEVLATRRRKPKKDK